ncbi:NUDIX hydrolase [Saccharothrix sp. Mg75]|uniref:NUDIX hydrolase n=1 Tax=Saccharothrix sp. Mg75 TaxID=3445357 RepID=UPI003EED288B
MQQVKLAGCVIRDDRGRVLLLHRNTPELRQWEIPGGKLYPDEDPESAARRELREEMGVEVAVGQNLGTRSFVENGRTMVYTWFLARITAGEPQALEQHIHDRWGYYHVTELAAMVEELSPNARNFLREVTEGNISI